MMQNFAIELFLDIAPPNLARLLGYKGSWRWIAFYWKSIPKGVCAPRHFDGHSYGVVDKLAWEAFFSHRLILAHNHRREDGYAIKRFDFGNECTVATHWLLLDRYNQRLYAGPEAQVAKFINIFMGQRPAQAEDDAEQKPDRVRKDHESPPPFRPDSTDIAHMTRWLDNRIAILEKSGKWPIFGR